MLEKYRKQQAIVTAFISIVILVAGTVIFLDSWATMQQIEARGLLGQAVYQEEYQEAVNQLRLAGVGVVIGATLFLNALVEDLKAMLEDFDRE